MDQVSLTLSKCLASLPDELLALILKFATLHEEGRDQTRSALWLSHVSRRFRTIMLGDRNLWSTLSLHHRTSEECLRAVIDRSGDDIDLHPVLELNSQINPADFRPLTGICTQYAGRWRTLTVEGKWESSSVLGNPNATINVELDRLMGQYPDLVLPRLEEIVLRETRLNHDFQIPVWRSFDSAFMNVASWEAPTLKTLWCTQYIPPPTLPITTFTTFVMSLTLLMSSTNTQLEELATFLSSKRTISQLFLRLEDYGGMASEAITPHRIPVAACPAVTSLDVGISDLNVSGVYSLVQPIVSAFQMANLKTFSLSLEFRTPYSVKKSTSSLISMLLPDPTRHPHLKSVSISIRISKKLRFTQKTDVKHKSFDISLRDILHIRHFCVTIPGPFTFITFCDRLPSRGYAFALPAIRELEFRSCENMDSSCLQDTVSILKATLVWKVLKRITVRHCPMLDRDRALEIVGPRRLVFIQ